MYKLKKIDISSVAIYSFIMILIISFVIFLPFFVLMQLFSSFGADPMMDETGFPNIFGGFIFIALPLFYAVFGTLVNVVIAWIYNLVSYRYGGIKIELNKVEDE